MENYRKFEAALLKYRPEILEKDPDTLTELYRHYMQVDALYVWLRNAYKDSSYVLGNEVRAILGHLSEYNENAQKDTKNLEKAYGMAVKISTDGDIELYINCVFKYAMKYLIFDIIRQSLD